jgi:hypothetical protein
VRRHSVFAADIGAMGYQRGSNNAATGSGLAGPAHMGSSGHVGLGSYMGHSLFDTSGMVTDPVLVAQDNLEYAQRRNSASVSGGIGGGGGGSSLGPASLPVPGE